MNPNLPKQKADLVLVDKYISQYAKNKLKELGINYIETVEIKTIADTTSTHPDMQFLQIGESCAIVESSTFEYYKKLLPDYNIIDSVDIFSPYPYDSVLNVTFLGEFCFLTEFQFNKLKCFLKNKRIIVKQGYTKCNICILNKNAIITSDIGIIKEAEKFGLRAYFLPNDEIILKGYKNGFWGGSTGLIDTNCMFFNGNIKELSCYNDLAEILKKEKIEPVYINEHKLTDVGSILPIL